MGPISPARSAALTTEMPGMISRRMKAVPDRWLAMWRSSFAQLLGVSVRTLQDWEQGRRAPSGAARTLLLIAARNPKALLDVA
jgi:DNA-binding transcriptional regulator YiaG